MSLQVTATPPTAVEMELHLWTCLTALKAVEEDETEALKVLKFPYVEFPIGKDQRVKDYFLFELSGIQLRYETSPAAQLVFCDWDPIENSIMLRVPSMIQRVFADSICQFFTRRLQDVQRAYPDQTFLHNITSVRNHAYVPCGTALYDSTTLFPDIAWYHDHKNTSTPSLVMEISDERKSSLMWDLADLYIELGGVCFGVEFIINATTARRLAEVRAWEIVEQADGSRSMDLAWQVTFREDDGTVPERTITLCADNLVSANPPNAVLTGEGHAAAMMPMDISSTFLAAALHRAEEFAAAHGHPKPM